MQLKIYFCIICINVLFMKVIYANNENAADTEDSLKWSTSNNNNYALDNPEECRGPHMEWLTDGPSCDVYCDKQPVLPKPHKGKRDLRWSNKVKPCQGRLEDFIQHEIHENDEIEVQHNARFIELNDKISKKVTNLMRTTVFSTNSVVKYEGCYCKDGYARYGLNCVSLLDCPSEVYESAINCNPEWNEHWEGSGPQCDLYCPIQPRGHRRKWNRNKCTDNIVDTLKIFDPEVENLESESGRSAFEKYAVNLTKELRASFSNNYVHGSVAYTGCYCDLGYARYGDICIEAKNCPRKITIIPTVENSNLCNGLHEEYVLKSDTCETYCDIQPLKYGRWNSYVNSCGGKTIQLNTTEKDEEQVTRLHLTKPQEDDGCYCIKGYARYGYRCVKFDECPSRKCHKDEIYLTCGPYCEKTCSNLHFDKYASTHECSNCPETCVPGCYCPANQVRDEKGRCIDPVNCWNYN